MIFKKSDPQKLEMAIAVLVLLGVNFIVTTFPRGWISWAASVPALLIIAITALARMRDITDTGTRWLVRRLGMILAGTSALALLLGPLLNYQSMYPSWTQVCIYWGFALAWLTTPNMPPWWKYINGDFKLRKGQQG
jgi:hypothetical protein